jgi:hypothetical protein
MTTKNQKILKLAALTLLATGTLATPSADALGMQNGLPSSFMTGVETDVLADVSKVSYAGKVWLVVGYGTQGMTSKTTGYAGREYNPDGIANTLTLLEAAASTYGGTENPRLRFAASSNEYGSSEYKTALEAYEPAASSKEYGLIVPRTLTAEDSNWDWNTDFAAGLKDSIKGTSAVTAGFWALSTREAAQLGAKDALYEGDAIGAYDNNGWWLRSPGNDASVAA